MCFMFAVSFSRTLNTAVIYALDIWQLWKINPFISFAASLWRHIPPTHRSNPHPSSISSSPPSTAHLQGLSFSPFFSPSPSNLHPLVSFSSALSWYLLVMCVYGCWHFEGLGSGVQGTHMRDINGFVPCVCVWVGGWATGNNHENQYLVNTTHMKTL